jgi:Histone chaperone domain CHZ
LPFIDILSADEPDEDNMEEIDTGNIIQDGRRTRGRKIDFSKAAEELPEEDDDEDDDDDFEAGDEDDEMKD